MFNHITTVAIDRFTTDFMVFLKDRSPVLFYFLRELITWLPPQDAYTKVRYKDFFTMVKLGKETPITLQRSFLVNDQVIASVTFGNRPKGDYDAVTETMRKHSGLDIVAGKEATDENLKLALGDSKDWSLPTLVLAASSEGIKLVELCTYDVGPTKVTYVFSGDMETKYFMEIEAANPRFLIIFCEYITYLTTTMPNGFATSAQPKFLSPAEILHKAGFREETPASVMGPGYTHKDS